MNFWTILPFIIFFVTLIFSRWILRVFGAIFFAMSALFGFLSEICLNPRKD